MRTAVLLSGGMDSIALSYWLKPSVAITVDYGHRPAAGEVRASTAAAAILGLEHHIIHADLSALGSGDLAGKAPIDAAVVQEWWPYRNQMLVTLAAMKAIELDVSHLLIATLRTDGSHADGRPAFVTALNELLCLQEGAITLEAPAIGLTALELAKTSGVPMELLAWAHSCHTAEYACGVCRGCRKHYETMVQLGSDAY